MCTRCSGVHRSFGHRVKGVSMSTFTEAELSEIVGNAAFSAVFLAGLPRGYVKPNAMGLDEVRRWIDDVYVKKKYYKEGSGGVGGEGAGRPRHLDISEEEIAVVPLSAILGASTPILRVESKGAEEARRVAAELAEAAQAAEAAEAAKAKAEVDLLGGWDPFGGGGGDADDAREAAVEVEGADVPSFEDEWATFVGDVKQDEPAPEQAASVADATAATTAVAAETTRETPLAAFYPEVEQMKKLQRAVAPPGGASSGASSGAPPQPRAAVPLEAFFPEFEEIRRSGVLPTGLPDPTRPRSAGPAAAVARAPDVAVAPAAPVALAAAVAIPPAPATQRSRSSAVERAGKTLGFGNPFDGGYDLTAEYCPQASHGGNPFA